MDAFVNNPSKKPTGTRSVSPDGDDVYAVGQTFERRPVPDFVAKYTEAGTRRRVSAADEPPPPPRLPMCTGVFTFPWRLSVLATWMLISLGLMVTAWFVMLWFGPGADVMGGMSARVFGAPTSLLCVLVFGYAATCCLTIIEGTSNGWDRVEVTPSMEWREWVWNFGRIAVLLFQAGMVGALFRWLDGSASYFPLVVGTFVAFPLVLLGALAADEAWAPLAIKTVLWSFSPLWWAWGLFYVETVAMAWAWVLLTRAGLREEPWLTPLYSAPLLAAMILIYARLVGRLAGCIVRETSKLADEGDDDAER
jgi:hypothetical protein